MTRRDFTTYALLLLLVAVPASFAWLTRHPEAAIVERAEGWPGVGPLARRFREAYVPPPPAAAEPEGAGEPVYEIEWIVEERPREGRVFLTPGQPIREEPAPEAPEVTTLRVYTNLEVLERRPGWVRIRYRDFTGWVPDDPERIGPEPPLGSAPEPVRALGSRPPDPEVLARARARLSGEEAAGRLGPYALYTDLGPSPRLERLHRIAAQVEGAYRSRYGREPLGEPAEAVVLFARERDYRAFQNESARLSGLTASGHSGHGLVALYDGGRPGEELASTLVHELAHLLNRRAVGPILPSWLDEGIADDLAQSRIDPAGRLDPGTLGGLTVRASRRVEMYGARAALEQLGRGVETGRLRPLPELLSLEWERFVGRGSDLHYAQSSFFVRYLLDGEGGALVPGFRAYLAAAADGGPVEPEALRQRLGRPWEELEAGFAGWVLEQRGDL